MAMSDERIMLICEQGHRSLYYPHIQRDTCTAPIHPDGALCVHVEGVCEQGKPCGADIMDVQVFADDYFAMRQLLGEMFAELTYPTGEITGTIDGFKKFMDEWVAKVRVLLVGPPDPPGPLLTAALKDAVVGDARPLVGDQPSESSRETDDGGGT